MDSWNRKVGGFTTWSGRPATPILCTKQYTTPDDMMASSIDYMSATSCESTIINNNSTACASCGKEGQSQHMQ